MISPSLGKEVIMFRHSAINIHAVDTALDQSEVAYQPLLAIWAIKIAIACRWHEKTRPTRLPEIFQEDEFSCLTGIIPPWKRTMMVTLS
jgi:hypothetical protein